MIMSSGDTGSEMDEKGSVLVVDDDATLLPLFEQMILSLGYRCITATNAADALEALRTTRFDIMLTDVAMPGVRGLELAERAKSLRPDMAVIIMTGFIADFSYDMAIEAGATDFIKKPFTTKELEARIRHVQMQERFRLQSITDELTGLYNRRGFFLFAEQLMKQAKRQKKRLYMLYADLDSLKAINDTLGHQEGDAALIRTANILRDTYRESDIVARIGGDEFAVIPLEIGNATMEGITSRLVKRFEECNAETGGRYRLSICFGLSCYDPEHPITIDQLLAEADSMMYEQKKLRRKA